MSEPLVIVGNGMAATRLVDHLTSRAPGRYDIAIIGDEPSLAYNRVLLSSLLAGEIDEKAIELKRAEWWQEKGVTLHCGRPAVEIDRNRQVVRIRGGTKLRYSKLVLATGSEPIRLPVPGADLGGVVTFRNKADTAVLLDRAKPGLRVTVVGGGLLGLEAAHGLAKAGAKVSIIHLMDRLMERQLDARAAAMLKAELLGRGMDVYLGAETAAIQGRRKATGVRLKDGRVIDTELVVMAVGIRPSVRLARTGELESIEGLSSTTGWPQATPASTRSENVPSTGASAMGSSIPRMSRRAYWPQGWPANPTPTPAR